MAIKPKGSNTEAAGLVLFTYQSLKWQPFCLSERLRLTKAEFRQSDVCAYCVLNCRGSSLRSCDLAYVWAHQRKALLEQQHGPTQIGNSNITWELAREANSAALPSAFGIGNCLWALDLCFNKPSGWFWCVPKFKSHYSRKTENEIGVYWVLELARTVPAWAKGLAAEWK